MFFIRLLEIYPQVLLFALGLFLVVKGGDWFVDAATWIAKALKVPTFIIGATIVSIATTLPEMIVSVIAAAEGRNDMAVGNAVGSVTANTALILAIALIFMHMVTPRKSFMKQGLLLAGAVAILLIASVFGNVASTGSVSAAFTDGGSLHFVGSILLGLIFIYFMFENVRTARKKPEIPDTLPESDEEMPANEKIPAKKIVFNVLLFLVGAAGIVLGSRLMVDNGEVIALHFGVPERVIAITLVAVGTSLPELVTTLTAIVKKQSDLSIGNIVGANIIDITLILPICSLVSGKQLPVSGSYLTIDLPVCLLVTLIVVIPLIIRQKSSRVQGIALLAVYAGYLAYSVIAT